MVSIPFSKKLRVRKILNWEMERLYPIISTTARTCCILERRVNPKTGKYDVPILTLNAVGEELFDKVTYKKRLWIDVALCLLRLL
jgi:hypothetical protein